MAESSWPFDAGPGAAVVEDRWRRLFRRAGQGRSFVASGLAVTAAGQLDVSVGAGAGVLEGGFAYDNDSPLVLTHNVGTAPSGSQNRVDLVVLRLRPVENDVRAAVVTGTPASPASAVAPAVTQQPTGVWELPIAQVTRRGTNSIQASDIVSLRLPEAPSFAADRAGGGASDQFSAGVMAPMMSVDLPASAPNGRYRVSVVCEVESQASSGWTPYFLRVQRTGASNQILSADARHDVAAERRATLSWSRVVPLSPRDRVSVSLQSGNGFGRIINASATLDVDFRGPNL